MNLKISFVIPCYNSENTIEDVINEIIVKINEDENVDYEIIAVNDSSPDGVWRVLKKIAKSNEKVKLLNLSKNMNKPSAQMAGFSIITGDIVVVLDDDGQCPINNLWELIRPLAEGYDVSIAKYPRMKQSTFKNFGSVINRKMTEVFLDKPKQLRFSNFVAMKRFVVEEIKKYKNPYPYLTGLILRTTSNIINVEMEERNRFEGSSSFTFKKSVSLWLNGVTAFSVKPLRIASGIGGLSAVVGFLWCIYLIIRKLITPNIAVGYTSLIAVILFVSGMLMIMLGIVGEYIGRIYISINNSPQYVIKEAVNLGENER